MQKIPYEERLITNELKYEQVTKITVITKGQHQSLKDKTLPTAMKTMMQMENY